MRSRLDTKPLLLAGVLCVLASVGPAGAQASGPAESASARACRPVVNPYPNSRYEGGDSDRYVAKRDGKRVRWRF